MPAGNSGGSVYAGLLVWVRCGHSKYQIPGHKNMPTRKMQLNNSIVTNKKNETLNNHLEMTNVPEIKPVSIQDAEKAAASVK